MKRYGHNLGYIDELHRRFLEDPSSVGEAWQEFFADYRAPGPESPSAAPSEPAPSVKVGARKLLGAPARIVKNMDASLGVPTATSARSIPVKMLEENRRVINAHQSTVSGPKISFTHLIAWAIVRALEKHPQMNVAFDEIDGHPHIIEREEIRLGLAIDLEKNGQRLLIVPNIRDAASPQFPAFVAAYDELVARARQNQRVIPMNLQGLVLGPGRTSARIDPHLLALGLGVVERLVTDTLARLRNTLREREVLLFDIPLREVA